MGSISGPEHAELLAEFTAEWSEVQRRLGEQGQALEHVAAAQRETNQTLKEVLVRLESSIAATREQSHAQISKVAETSQAQIAALGKELNTRTNTDIFKVAGLVGSAVTLLVLLYTWGPQQQVTYLQQATEKMAADLAGHMSNGHPHTVVERTERNRSAISDLREMVQAIQVNRVPREEWERHHELLVDRDIRLLERLARLEGAKKDDN